MCDEYSSIPPSSGFEVLADHLVHLMEEVSDLKKEVAALKESTEKEKYSNIIDIN